MSATSRTLFDPPLLFPPSRGVEARAFLFCPAYPDPLTDAYVLEAVVWLVCCASRIHLPNLDRLVWVGSLRLAGGRRGKRSCLKTKDPVGSWEDFCYYAVIVQA
jgi:hypothetical protein